MSVLHSGIYISISLLDSWFQMTLIYMTITVLIFSPVISVLDKWEVIILMMLSSIRGSSSCRSFHIKWSTLGKGEEMVKEQSDINCYQLNGKLIGSIYWNEEDQIPTVYWELEDTAEDTLVCRRWAERRTRHYKHWHQNG